MPLPLLVLAKASPDAWVRSQLAYGVSIEAPGKMADGGATGPVRFYVLAQKPIAYIVSIYTPRPGEKPATAKVKLHSFAAGMANSGAGRMDWQKDIALSGHPGIDAQYTDKVGMRTHFRAFVFGDRIVEAGVSWKSGPEPKTVDRFLGSLKLPK